MCVLEGYSCQAVAAELNGTTTKDVGKWYKIMSGPNMMGPPSQPSAMAQPDRAACGLEQVSEIILRASACKVLLCAWLGDSKHMRWGV